MYLSRLSLRNFRNFERLRIELPPDGAALIGGNGQGKTSLLEAVYYLEIFRSFRGARDDQLITFGADFFRVEGSVRGEGESGREVELAAAYGGEARVKKITVDGTAADRISEAIGRLCAVVFTADDVEIVAGSPGERRRFMNIVLSLVEPGYLAALQRYRGILSQRNELLRDGASAAELSAWSHGLVECGSGIMGSRARWIEAVRDDFARHYETISGGARAEIEYAPSVRARNGADVTGDGAEDRWAAGFRNAIERVADRERRRGVTLVGPHRDDVRFSVAPGEERMDLRAYGSAGQQRTAAIALKMVEADTLSRARDRAPLLMLDDVFAELDPDRASRVMEFLEDQRWGQVIVTSPKPGEFASLGGRLREYRIRDGAVRPA